MSRPLASYRGWTIERYHDGGLEAVHPDADEPLYADDLVMMTNVIDRAEAEILEDVL